MQFDALAFVDGHERDLVSALDVVRQDVSGRAPIGVGLDHRDKSIVEAVRPDAGSVRLASIDIE